MDFPRGIISLTLISTLYVLLQFLFFIRVKRYLEERIKDQKGKRLLAGLLLFFCLLTFLPFFWRMLLGRHFGDHHPVIINALFTAFAVWGPGSTGAALIFLGYDFCRRAVFFSRRQPAEPNLERREFLKRTVGMAAAAPFLVSGYGTLLGRREFRVEEFELPVGGLSRAVSDLSIVQLTDIHVGPFMPAEELAAYVEAVNRLQPHLILITGDFVTSKVGEVAPCVDTLAGLRASHGIFACLGNHDVFSGAQQQLTRSLGHNGIRVLRNDAASVRIDNTLLNILGIDDLLLGHPDLSRAVKIANGTEGEVNLLLSHRPEVFPAAAGKGVDIVLSGHYHGGQIKLFPDAQGLSIARLLTPYPEGLFRLPRQRHGSGDNAKGAVLFVGRGIGVTALPIRVNCPPQIAHLKLVRA